jgi:hypothetical protein
MEKMGQSLWEITPAKNRWVEEEGHREDKRKENAMSEGAGAGAVITSFKRTKIEGSSPEVE